MAQITEPPVIPNLSLPVPQRTDPENFSERMDRTLLEIPLTVDGINLTVRWTYDTAQLVKGFSQAAAQSAADAAQQVELAKQEVKQSEQFAQRSAYSADESKGYRDSAAELIRALGQDVGLPEDPQSIGLPMVNLGQGEVRFTGSMRRYDVRSVDVESEVDLSQAQVFTIDASTSSQQVSIVSRPEEGKSMVFIVIVTGNRGVVWPSDVNWLRKNAPQFANRAKLTFLASNGQINEVGRIIE